MKKILALLTVIVLSFSLVGCGVKELGVKGEKITKERAVEVIEEWNEAAKENPDDSEGWLKLKGKLELGVMPITKKTHAGKDLFTRGEASLEGKFYNAKDINDINGYVELTFELFSREAELDGVKETEIKGNIKFTAVDGFLYLWSFIKTETDGEVESETIKNKSKISDAFEELPNYDGSSGESGVASDLIINDLFASFEDLFGEDAEKLELYEFRNGLMLSMTTNESVEGKDVDDSVVRASLKMSKGGARFNSASIYASIVAPISADVLRLKTRIDFSTALFGSVKAPENADEYKLL